MKYPVDKNKDKEIAEYVERMKRKVDNFESSFQRELDSLFSRIEHHTFRNWRDPALTPIKNDMRKCTKEFSGQLKRTMDEANQDAEHYLSTKISVNSIIELSDMIAHIFHIGDGIRVTFNESTTRETRDIAQFTWPEKYFRIAHKWQTIKKELPTDPEQEDRRKEYWAMKRAEMQLNKAEDKLEKALEDVEEAEKYIRTAPQILTKKKEELKILMDAQPEKIAALQAAYHDKVSKLKEDLRTAEAKKSNLEVEITAETDRLDKLFILAFRKRKAIKQRISDLAAEIVELGKLCEETEQEILTAKDTYQSEANKLEDELNSLREEIKDVEEKLLSYETIIKSKQGEIEEIRQEISSCELRLQDFHKKYLLENYRNIISN